MKKNRMKYFLLTAVGLLLVGAVLFAVGFLVLGGRPGFYIDSTGFHSLSESKESNIITLEKTKLSAFEEIDINMEYADMEIIPSDDFYIEYRMPESYETEYSVKGNTLTVSSRNGSFGHFSFMEFALPGSSSSGRTYIKIYVPEKTELKEAKLRTSSGDVTLAGELSIHTLTVKDEYGKVIIDTLKSKKTELKLSSGKVVIEKIEADSFTLSDEYGHVIINEYASDEGKIRLSSGNLELQKADFTELEINDEYGHVQVELMKKLEEYDVKFSTEYGKIILPDGTVKKDNGETVKYREENKNAGVFKIQNSSGNITSRKPFKIDK